MRDALKGYESWANRLRIRFSLLSMLLLLVLFVPSLYWIYREAMAQEQRRVRDVLENYVVYLESAVRAMGVDVLSVDSASVSRVRALFRNPLMGQTMYPFIVLPSGEVAFHFFRYDARLSQEALVEMGRSPQRRGSMFYNFGNPLANDLEISYYYSQPMKVYVAVEYDRGIDSTLRGRLRLVIALVLVLALLLVLVLTYAGFSMPMRYFMALRSRIEALARGEHPAKLGSRGGKDLQAISVEVNRLIEGLGKTAAFALEIGKQNFSSSYEPLGPKDVLGNALLEMRESIRVGREQAARQKEEESIRNWMNSSMAEFGRILREHGSDIQGLTDSVLQQLVSHLGAVEGGFYIAEEDSGESYLQLRAAVAYGRKKYTEDRVSFGEGLVGTCALEREMIYLTVIPENYCTITSGIGETHPNALLLMPLKSGEELYGVIEMASLNLFAEHEIQFVQLLSESIASTLMSAQNNERTSALLRESQAQRQQMHEQEETMRQNLEEVRATQEAMERRREQLQHLEMALSESFLYGEVDERLAVRTCNQRMLHIGEVWGLPFFEGGSLLDAIRAGGESVSAEQVARSVAQNRVYTVTLRMDRGEEHLILQLTFSRKLLAGGERGYYVLGAAFTRCQDGAVATKGARV